MFFIDNFKFFSPFFKEKASKVIDNWSKDMDEYVTKTTTQNPTLSIDEARFVWLFIKMAELEAVNINAQIAEDWKRQNL